MYVYIYIYIYMYGARATAPSLPAKVMIIPPLRSVDSTFPGKSPMGMRSTPLEN